MRLDFDEDLDPLDTPAFLERLGTVAGEIRSALETATLGQLMDRGVQVAIVGRPNVGKSSLMNRWTATDRAIVTEIAGTTRDIVEAPLSVRGVPVTLLDTAGVRDTEDVVEGIGVERALKAAAAADVVLWVVDASDGVSPLDLAPLRTVAAAQTAPVIAIANKVDAAPGFSAASIPDEAQELCRAVVLLSAKTGSGIEDLDAALLGVLGAPDMVGGPVGWAVNARQAEALQRACEALERVQGSVAGQLPEDFWTIDLKDALIAMGEVTGDDVTEEVLDNIFSKFCIGK